jgi:hypothetical protein
MAPFTAPDPPLGLPFFRESPIAPERVRDVPLALAHAPGGEEVQHQLAAEHG